MAGFTACRQCATRGTSSPGYKVLLNGAAGVGTFTVQIANAFGAEVTGMCSTQNVEMVASIGAGQVIDYTRQDFTRARRGYDLLVDIAGNRTLAETRRVLVPNGCWWRWEARTRTAGSGLWAARPGWPCCHRP
jgi:NADPH:quinone reductase-like Zn-dependent oxidoreductase